MHNYRISFNVECTLVFQLIKINTNIASLNIINLHLRSSSGLKGKAGYTKGQFCTNCTQFASVWSYQNRLNRTVIFMCGRGQNCQSYKSSNVLRKVFSEPQ